MLLQRCDVVAFSMESNGYTATGSGTPSFSSLYYYTTQTEGNQFRSIWTRTISHGHWNMWSEDWEESSPVQTRWAWCYGMANVWLPNLYLSLLDLFCLNSFCCSPHVHFSSPQVSWVFKILNTSGMLWWIWWGFMVCILENLGGRLHNQRYNISSLHCPLTGICFRKWETHF